MIINVDPPAESTRVLAEELAWAVGTGSLARLVGRPVQPEELTATVPHPAFALHVNDVRHDRAPILVGWRYLIELAGQVVVQASTYLADDGTHRFGGFAAGSLVAATVVAAQEAEDLLAADPEPLTLAAVGLPALHVSVLQATRADGTARAFLTIGRRLSLAPAHLYTREEIYAELLRLADQAPNVPNVDRDEPTGG